MIRWMQKISRAGNDQVHLINEVVMGENPEDYGVGDTLITSKGYEYEITCKDEYGYGLRNVKFKFESYISYVDIKRWSCSLVKKNGG